MKKIPSQFVQELKHTLNIVDIAGDYMKLAKKGSNHFALCPFHSEKTPSFSVSEQRQIFYCFGCQKKGDVISLVMELDGLSYVEAIHHLGEKAGLKIPFIDAGEEKEYRDRTFLFTVMEEAVTFYQKCLQSDDGRKAHEYLRHRCINSETAQQFKLGYSPINGFHLVSYLRSLGIKDQYILDAGLASRSKTSGKLYDQFRNRFMIPICDLHGRTIAFGGRILDQGEPKYLNSRETPIYHKGRHLFGLNLSSRHIRSGDEAVLVEGYFDMLIPFQEGVTNIVASLGTSLTPLQVKLVGRFSKNVVISFDPDAAGTTAAYRSVELFLENDFECRVALLPEGYDPDTFALEKGGTAYRQALDEAFPFLEFVWQRVNKPFDGVLTAKDRVKIMEKMFPFLLKIPRAPERSEHLSQLAARLELDQPAIFRHFQNYSKTRNIKQEQVQLQTESDVFEPERLLIKFLFTFPELAPEIILDNNVTFEGFRSSNILANILDMVKNIGRLELNALESQLPEADLILLHQILVDVSWVVSEEDARNCVEKLRNKALGKGIEDIVIQMQQAEKEGDMDRCRLLLMKKKEIERKRN